MFIALIFLISLVLILSCQSAGFLFTEKGEIECGGDGKAIILDNNPVAENPSFGELIEFIKIDRTDTKDYIASGPGAYVCADFAEEVHNNAEKVGIRAGWVGITFNDTGEGHAINAFETTDRGLVYIDCTNGRAGHSGDGSIDSWDTIAYIKIGEKYGVIHIDRVKSLGYNYYVEYEEKWGEYRDLLEAYNTDVDRYNKEISGKIFIIGSPEAISMDTWKDRLTEKAALLDEMEAELGNHWYESEYSSHTVKNVRIHW